MALGLECAEVPKAKVRENFKKATCHPDRRHAAKRLCFSCYSEEYPKARRATCHPDRIYHSKGLCKVCSMRELQQSNPEFAAKQKENHRKWNDANYARNLERVREHGKQERVRKRKGKADRERLLASFGLTWTDEVNILERQGGSCGICGEPPDRAHFDLDHDHTTMKVRGLLCGRCNKGLGLLGDNSKTVAKALAYLQASASDFEGIRGGSIDDGKPKDRGWTAKAGASPDIANLHAVDQRSHGERRYKVWPL